LKRHLSDLKPSVKERKLSRSLGNGSIIQNHLRKGGRKERNVKTSSGFFDEGKRKIKTKSKRRGKWKKKRKCILEI